MKQTKFITSVAALIFIVSTLILLAGCGSGDQKTTTVTGNVFDKLGNPIEGAEVTINSNPVMVTTDSNGFFSARVEVGNHEIFIRKGAEEIFSGKFTCDIAPFSMGEMRTLFVSAGDFDADGDGYSMIQGDCNDNDADIHPGAQDICEDGIDQDCNGSNESCTPTLISNIEFVDSNLAACVDSEAKDSGLANVDELTSLDCENNGIEDITGIAWLINLQELNLDDNSISDISAIAGLTNLQDLSLWSNNISDISALSGLTNLQYLVLWSNNISDVSILAGLLNLEELDLEDNNITNVSVLAGLTGLKSLYLAYNSITTGVADLAALVSAEDIYLDNNPQIPCSDLDTLETALGSSVLERDNSPDCAP